MENLLYFSRKFLGSVRTGELYTFFLEILQTIDVVRSFDGQIVDIYIILIFFLILMKESLKMKNMFSRICLFLFFPFLKWLMFIRMKKLGKKF